MSWQMLKQKREERADVMKSMKQILELANTEKRDLTADESKKFDELSGKETAIQADIQRCETLTALESRSVESGHPAPGRENVNTPETREKQAETEQRAAFNSFIRRGSLTADENRALTVSGQTAVGPRGFAADLIVAMKSFDGLRQAGATIISTTDGNDFGIPVATDTANKAVIVGEGSATGDVTEPTLTTKTLKSYKFDSGWVKVSTEMLQDNAFNVEAFIVTTAGERIGRGFLDYSTTGTGTGQPTGVLTSASTGKTAASTSAITYDDLLDLLHSVDSGYRNSGRAKWMLHDTTLAAIRKLKDGEGRYIFAAGAAGAPSSILDYGYVCNNAIPTLASGAGSKVIAYGDFSRYFIRDVATPAIQRANELFISDGLVGFKVWSRHDGILTDTAAVKVLKLAAS